jgi:hypothetical protein
MTVKVLRSSGLLLVLVLIIMAGCKGKEGCTDPYSENYDETAEVDNNTCISPRDKFSGVYTVQYLCSGSQPPITLIQIKPSNINLTDIKISTLDIFSIPIRAAVSKSAFLIPFQTDFVSYRSIQGNGTIVGNNVTIEYTLYEGVNKKKIVNSCVATLFN